MILRNEVVLQNVKNDRVHLLKLQAGTPFNEAIEVANEFLVALKEWAERAEAEQKAKDEEAKKYQPAPEVNAEVVNLEANDGSKQS